MLRDMKSDLSSKQVFAIAAIASGKSQAEAAVIVDVTPQTICKWMQKPEFRECIDNYKTNMLVETQDKLRGLTTLAVATIGGILENSKNERIRFEAAKYIIDRINVYLL